MKKTMLAMLSATWMAAAVPSAQAEMTLVSSDIQAGKMMPKAQEFQGFGCSGGNQSPQLSWAGAPDGTEAFALLVHDPDAPTGGSGWWHWQLVNIPASTTSLAAGAGSAVGLEGNSAEGSALPKGALQIENDYGVKAFGGACPPEGDKPHRYRFTLYALSQPLSLPDNPSSALTGYMVNAYSLESVTLEALYQR